MHWYVYLLGILLKFTSTLIQDNVYIMIYNERKNIVLSALNHSLLVIDYLLLILTVVEAWEIKLSDQKTRLKIRIRILFPQGKDSLQKKKKNSWSNNIYCFIVFMWVGQRKLQPHSFSTCLKIWRHWWKYEKLSASINYKYMKMICVNKFDILSNL